MPANPYLQGLSALSVKVKGIFLKPFSDLKVQSDFVDLAATAAVENLQDQESQNLKPNEVLMNQSFRYPEVLS